MSKSILPVELGFRASAAVDAAIRRGEGLILENHWRVEVLDERGRLVELQEFENLVTTVGRNYILNVGFKGVAADSSWFVGLKDAGAAAAGDTMASHAGWVEMGGAVPLYSEATRQALTLGTVASGAVDNSAAKAVFTIDAADTVYGAFLNTDSDIDGTTGTLYAAGDIDAPIALLVGWTMNVQVTLTAASA